ncbi:MAG TPA: type IV secretory system conjugative DNA transfer family protein [Acidimicrobiales bacterium]|nr:type IV secretory system conjugative DNA transfer family protein [Acidimicrobiales bacterium]
MERNGLSVFEFLLIAGAAIVGFLGGAVWLGAWVAAAASDGRLDASFSDAVGSGLRLPSHLGDPRLAWPPEMRPALPGALAYWGATGVVMLAAIAIAVVLFRLLSRSKVGTLPRRPLGVDARARFATATDLKPLIVRGDHPGRFLLGDFGRHSLATELAPKGMGRGRRSKRRGDRGAVALIGPSRSGKTTAAVSGILEWEGPAVLSSVKADLLGSTCGWRKTKGKVLVYDPTHSTGDSSAVWSPLRAAKTVLGAQRAARALCEAAPRGDNVKGNYDFWLSQAEILMFGLMWTAVQTDKDMAKVCEWVMVQDRPRPDGPGDVRTALDRLLKSNDPDVCDGAVRASQAVMGIWEMEDETRSSVYSTAQTVVWPWADPGVAAASRGDSLSLDWVLGGPNTLYLCAPIEDQERLAPAFGGLLNDLVKQVFLRVAADGKPLDPPLLIVIDEAGNTPLRALPQYASTLAGLGVLLVTIWQSIAQIEAAYYRQADTILTNHLSKVFYSGLSDPVAFRYIAAVLGDVEVETRSRSEGSAEARNSLQLSTTREPLVPPHMARQMPPGDALLIHGTLPPAHVRTRPWWADRRLAARGELDPRRSPTLVVPSQEVTPP